MKVTVLTSNQRRHLSLVRRLARISDVTHAVLECNTLFPGRVQDFFNRSEVMQRYFREVLAAEKRVFGEISPLGANVRVLPLKAGDLGYLEASELGEGLEADVFVVFGASYIKGWLADLLIERQAVNIHMGLSPYYRGSSCNFWALYDDRPECVGATIHLLSKGLDSGPILYHAVPSDLGASPFEYTMLAVAAAQDSLVDRIASGQLLAHEAIRQDRSCELRYTRNADFTDDAASAFLARGVTVADIKAALSQRDRPQLIRPYFA